MTTYVLGGGCFWCLDAVYRGLKGIARVVSGYAGGDTVNPAYYQVCQGTTGHAEVVEITFDEAVIPLDTVLDIFFTIHDPTTPNRQGADEGPEYRSIMLYASPEQQQAFEAARERAKAIWSQPIVTQIMPMKEFYPAEEEHQDYFNKHPEAGYCQVVISPKLRKARAAYRHLFVTH